MSLQSLEPTFHERIWGTKDLSPWFPNSSTEIGEVWFDAGTGVPLVKLIFAREKLSVQVHPPGKTEMWHVLEAAPDSRIAAGFREPVTREQVRAAALSGEIENLLGWFDARAGDTFFIPAGTVHAIGGGLTICEVQQHAKEVFRLYDYGRPRELHLDQGLEVARLAPHEARTRLPVQCPFFVTDVAKSGEPSPGRPEIWIGLQGKLAGKAFLHTGERSEEEEALASATDFLRTYIP